MEKKLLELDGFVQLHASRISDIKGRKVAFMTYFNGSVPLNCQIKAYSTEDIIEKFDTESVMVRYVLDQIQQHDEYTEKVMGLIFSNTEMLCKIISIKKN